MTMTDAYHNLINLQIGIGEFGILTSDKCLLCDEVLDTHGGVAYYAFISFRLASIRRKMNNNNVNPHNEEPP